MHPNQAKNPQTAQFLKWKLTWEIEKSIYLETEPDRILEVPTLTLSRHFFPFFASRPLSPPINKTPPEKYDSV